MALCRPQRVSETIHDREELRMFETEEAIGLLLRKQAALNKVQGEGEAWRPR